MSRGNVERRHLFLVAILSAILPTGAAFALARSGQPIPQRVLDWLRDVIDKVLNASSPGTAAGLVLLVIVLAVVIVLLLRIGRTVQRDPGGVAVHENVGRPATDWRAAAARHEAAGEWRDALRCRYRALVADLAARGLVDEIPGRTTGEYRAEVAESVPAADRDFGVATDLFERAWYGAADAGPDENERLRGAADRVLQGAGR